MLIFIESLNTWLAHLVYVVLSASGQFAWEWEYLKLKFILNLLSLIIWLSLIYFAGAFLWDKYVTKPKLWEDPTWTGWDYYKIIWTWFWGIFMVTKLLGTVFWPIIVYLIS